MHAFPNLVLQSCSLLLLGRVLENAAMEQRVGQPCACAPCHCPPCPQETRLKEGIVKLKPHEEPLRSELLSGKFTILVGGVSPMG